MSSFSKQKGKWQAYVSTNGKLTHLGYFDTKEKADDAERLAREKYPKSPSAWSGYRGNGVRKRRNRYFVNFTVNGKKYNHPGSYATLEEAKEIASLLKSEGMFELPPDVPQTLSHNNTSGTKGVCWDKRSKKWQAYIYRNRKNKNLGYFNTIEEAIAARKAAENA